MRLLAILAFFTVLIAQPCLAKEQTGVPVNKSDEELIGVGEAAKEDSDDFNLAIPPADRDAVLKSKEFRSVADVQGTPSKSRKLTEEQLKIRPKALAEAAERLGFQEGYFHRYKKISGILKQQAVMLDNVFNFTPFLLEGGRAMPPVITQADAYAEIKNPDEMVQTGTAYKILKPARFVTVPPSWRDYLLVPEGAVRPEKIHPAILPLDSAERKIWRDAIEEQWFAGMEHADRMFQIGVNKLLVDLRGIIQYKVLENRGYVSMPKISSGYLSIRVGDENLEFDQQTFRITEKARFQDVKRDKVVPEKTSAKKRKKNSEK